MSHPSLHRLMALLLAASLLLALAGSPVSARQNDGDPLDASTLTLNVEVILDSSGSMAESLPGTDQSRMDAAKEAMRDVIYGIPERDGLNVGFRVYGHEGSNSDADREISCSSTELLVPIDGVDREELLAEVEAAAPTGWTPLALSLEAAADDFAHGGESVTNAVIMVTDGEETCGGDPCSVAGALNVAEIGLTTHVVGFALTPEQTDAVGCIAAEGGGELFAADDARSLTEAVFSALSKVDSTPEPEEVEAEVITGGYVGGNAFGLLDEGEPGELSVVAIGAYDGSYLPVVIKNDTGEHVMDVQASVVARSNGELVATGAGDGFYSRVVQDGSYAFGEITFGEELPGDAEFEFELFAIPADEDDPSTLDLVLEEANGDGAGIVGIFANPHEVPVGDPNIEVGIACFDGDGALLDVGFTPAGKSLVDAGGTVPFDVSLPNVSGALETESCPVYLVAANGNVW